MNDTKLLDWISNNLTTEFYDCSGGQFLTRWVSKVGKAHQTLNYGLRDCIRKAMETEQQNKTTAATVKRRPLTEEQIKNCILQSNSFGDVRLTYTDFPYNKTCITEEAIALVRAIEKAHGIKELKE